jgi:hypothetical protein
MSVIDDEPEKRRGCLLYTGRARKKGAAISNLINITTIGLWLLLAAAQQAAAAPSGRLVPLVILSRQIKFSLTASAVGG